MHFPINASASCCVSRICLAFQGADLASVADTAVQRIRAIVDYMLEQEPGIHVVLQGLLPRGMRSKDTGEMAFEQPSMYVQ